MRARMRQREPARQRRGAQFLARLQAGQQGFGSLSWPVFSASATRSRRTDALVLDVMAEAMAPAASISGRMVSCGRIFRVRRVDCW